MDTPVSFQLPDWTLRQSQPNAVWTNEAGDQLSLHHFAIPPDIPHRLTDLNALIRFYREQITQAGGGLMDLSVVDIDKVAAVKTIMKLPRGDRQIVYLGSFTIPRRDESYVIKMQCVDDSPTGVRESIVMDQLLGQGALQFADDGSTAGWMHDPYDASIQGTGLMNQAEAERYDASFPTHSLSRLRQGLNDLQVNIILSETLKESPPFHGPRSHPKWRFW